MKSRQWRLQDAKTQFSQVVEEALRGEPQHVSRRGKAAVVVVSATAFAAMQRSARQQAPGLVAHLLAMPRGEAKSDDDATLALRDLDF